MIEVGSFVQSQNNNLGIGKVIEISGFDVIVEYFCSVGQSSQKTVPLNSLSPVRLEHQTRCYIKWTSLDEWIIGRIAAWDEEIEQYQIDLPNKRTMLASEEEIYVRCNLPITDPTETLAIKGHETPYFHDRRLALAKCLIQQRAVSQGMTGLMSANIELYPHQVEVVRRVLGDPIQRYLLADDVGLGKTVEAGVILRQFLIDEPQKTAVVVVPRYLVQQWRTELENKFYISHFPNRVAVVTLEDIHQIRLKVDIGCVILDEAQQIAAMAVSRDATVRQRFDACKNLAYKSDRLLLLSSTPVLHHERDFLVMLHLLDPTSYKLDDVQGFRARVATRQEIGRVLLALKAATKPTVLKTNLQQLRHLLAEDEYLLKLVDDWENCLQTNSPEQEQIVRAICTHIQDTYRLSRRMLRNSRAAVEDVIFDRNIIPKEEYDLDERSLDIHELIDQWRTVAPHQEQYKRIFLLLFRASGTWLGILEQVITARLSGKADSRLIQEFGTNDVQILTSTAQFPEEAEILQSILKILRQPLEDGERRENLKTVLLNQLAEFFKIPPTVRKNQNQLLLRIQQRIRRPTADDTLPKIVVFTSFVQSCTAIVRYLSDIFGEATVASYQFGESPEKIQQSISRFQDNPNCWILVCDRTGEAGLNLQFADCLIHFDLPWSPNQLEQRISRIDRIGSKIAAKSSVLIGPYLEDSPHNAWYQLLKDGFGIFQQSIASLQFYVDEKLAALETTLFQSSAAGLLAMVEPIQAEITAEIGKISEQNVLDEIDANDEVSIQTFADLDNYDACHLEIKQAIEGWLCDVLAFKPINNPNSLEMRRYQPTTRTLVPINELKSRFANSYLEQFATYKRRVANQNPGIKLLRIGEPLVESVSNYMAWDDRGQAFAIWRTDPSWDAGEGMEWFGFRCNYLIEANLTFVQQVLIDYKLDSSLDTILKRRVDALLPPTVKTIFIDARYEPMSIVEDEILLNILERPYQNKTSNHRRDYNLAKERLAILDNFVDASKWRNLCEQTRQTSGELLTNHPDFIDWCQKSTQAAEQELGNRLEKLHLRLNRQPWEHKLAEELNIESALKAAILEGIRQPQMTLDSVGFMIVSGRNPLQLAEEGVD
ncbi:protein DpdE [Anabaena sp. 4-3]|uniref:protein DpdE n=1 Tax=Anabaena sp. 4-3 TaxID=1811979 RepID=UPI0008367F7E|nr:protein DpdE [Anabaena sp. 4-3]